MKYGPSHAIFVLIAHAHTSHLNVHSDLSSENRCLTIGWSLPLLLNFVHTRSEGSGKTAHMRSLAWAIATRRCDKYQNFVCWHMWLTDQLIAPMRPMEGGGGGDYPIFL